MLELDQILVSCLDQGSDPIWVVNDQLELIYTNKAYLKWVGQLVPNKTARIDSHANENGHVRWRVQYSQALDGNTISVTESLYDPAISQITYGDVRFNPVRDMSGKVIAVSCNLRFISPLRAHLDDGTQVHAGTVDKGDKSVEFQTRLRRLSNSVPGVLYQYHLLADGTDELNFVSDGSLEIWKLSPEECFPDTKKVWSQIIAGGDIAAVRKSIEESASSLTPWFCQWRNVWPDGSIRWHEGRGTPEKLADGSVIWDALVVDISEKKKLEELLQETTTLARVGSWELDLTKERDGIYWSPMLKEILEVGPDYDPSITNGFEFYHGETLQLIQRSVDDLIHKATPFDLELCVSTAKGRQRWVRCIGRGEFVNGECVRIYGSYQDIHDKKTAMTMLSEILNSISKSFIALDKDWRLLFFNREAEKVFDLKSERVIGKSVWDTMPLIAGTVLEETFRRVAADRKDQNVEYLLNGKWYEVNAYPSEHGISVYFKNIDERKIAAEALRRAYEEKTNIIESIADAFFTVDRNFNVLYWNHSAERLLGVKREDVVGKNLWKVFPQAVDLPSYRNYRQVLQTGQPVTFEDYFGMWLEVNAYPNDEGLTVFFRDITIRKEAAEKLRSAYEERNQILESIGDAFFAVDTDWIVTYWNRVAADLLHKSKEEMVGRHLWTVFENAIGSISYTMFYRATETGEIVSFEQYYAGLEKWMEVTAYPSPTGLSVYFKDVTLRKQSDLQIREANERFEKVSGATNEAIWEWNIKQNTLYRGSGFKKLFGYDAKKDTPLTEWVSQVFDGDRSRILDSLDHYLANDNGTVWEQEYRYQKSDGTFADVIDRGVLIRDASGHPVRMVGAMQDITFHKEYQKELERLNETLKENIRELKLANEDLEQFAYIASHDLQEPLRMVFSFMDLLQKRYGHQLDERANEYIHFAHDGAKRMKTIILDLLSYSRAGKKGILLEKIDLHELLMDYQILRRTMITEKNVTIHTRNLSVISGFKAPLVQTLHCLLDNAIKYSREDEAPVIHITATEHRDEWVLRIEDNGIGIDNLCFDKIFVIFQRLHNREQYDGNGIGLAIVKKNVESWGGKVWLESQPGEGTTFYFSVKK